MKKVLSILVAVLLIASLATTAFAAEYEIGDTVTVSFTYDADPAMSDYKARLSYDSSVLELVSFSGNVTGNVKKAICTYAQTTDIAAGELFTATFNVIGYGETNVSASIDYAYNAAGEEVTASIAGGANVVVTKPTEPTEPTEPETEPTEPETKPTEPTEPETEPTEPETKPTEHEHDWSNWTMVDAGNCVTKSTWERICASCGEKETKEGEYGDHEYKNGTCVHCGAKDPNWVEPEKPVDPDLDDEPKTGDITPVVTMTIAGVVAMAAAAFFFVFKRNAAK